MNGVGVDQEEAARGEHNVHGIGGVEGVLGQGTILRVYWNMAALTATWNHFDAAVAGGHGVYGGA